MNLYLKINNFNIFNINRITKEHNYFLANLANPKENGPKAIECNKNFNCKIKTSNINSNIILLTKNMTYELNSHNHSHVKFDFDKKEIIIVGASKSYFGNVSFDIPISFEDFNKIEVQNKFNKNQSL